MSTDMTLGQGHDKSWGHVQVCEILFRSKLAVRCYGHNTNFRYVCTMTLALVICPWAKVVTHPSVVRPMSKCTHTLCRVRAIILTDHLFANGTFVIAIGRDRVGANRTA